MAAVAGHLGVQTLQRKCGSLVVEAPGFDDHPAVCLVAGRAAGSQVAFVRVPVTRGTSRLLPEDQSVRRFEVAMAVGATDLSVGATEGKVGLRMVESLGGSPGSLVVTVGTGLGAEFCLVWVAMAALAARVETQERSVEVLSESRQLRRLLNGFAAMAGSTVELRMLAFGQIAGQGVVERVDPLVAPPDQFEFFAVMFDMAALALFVAGRGVQASVGCDSALQGLMALETEVGSDSGTGTVTI